jgi:hypothetical protein
MDKKLVYGAISKVQGELAKIGISKGRQSTQGATYWFRGIDDVYNAVAPLLPVHGLVIIPRMVSRVCVDRLSNAGKAIYYVTVDAEFDFVSAEDGSMHTAKTFGEAMDSGDKATNKAMSAAYKYALFQIFCIPTEGDNDSENHNDESGVDVTDHLTVIKESADMAKLKENYVKAMKTAGADKFAISVVTKATNKRKAELSPPEVSANE